MKQKNIRISVIIGMIAILGFFHIYLRMQCVEKDYAINDIRKKIEKVSLLNKELKAKRARLLSSKNLRSYAKSNDLKEPTSKQIIVIRDL